MSNINKPKHYTYSKIETIDVIEEWQLNYHLGNVVKYISRAGIKDPYKTIEDLEKAAWYLNRHIEKVKKEEEETEKRFNDPMNGFIYDAEEA